MKCPDNGKIQAYIDWELNEFEKSEIKSHLSECKKCQKTYSDLNILNNFCSEKIENYQDVKENDETIKRPFIYKAGNRKGVFDNMKKYKKIAASICAALVIATCVTVKPIRAAIADFVSIFRVNNIESISISLQDIENLQQQIKAHKSEIDIEKIGKIKVDGGKSKDISIKEAKDKIPFAIIPTSLSENDIRYASVCEPSKIDFTINVNNVNKAIKSFGGTKLFPESLDGKTFSLNFTGSLQISYKIDGKNVHISEFKAPEVLGPSDADIVEIYNAFVELPILPQDLQKQLKSAKDWKNTLYVPNVDNKTEEIKINGNKAYLINDENKDSKYNSVIWISNGTIFEVGGNLDKNKIIEIAESMR